MDPVTLSRPNDWGPNVVHVQAVQVDAATDGFSLKGPGWTNPLSPHTGGYERCHRPHILNLSTCEC